MVNKELYSVPNKDELVNLFLQPIIRILHTAPTQRNIIPWKIVNKRLSLLHFNKKNSRKIVKWLYAAGFLSIHGTHGVTLNEKSYAFLSDAAGFRKFNIARGNLLLHLQVVDPKDLEECKKQGSKYEG